MMKKLVYFCACFVFLMAGNAVFSATLPLRCPTDYPKSENKLIAVIVFNKAETSDDIFELAPSEEATKGDKVKQYWEDMNVDPAFKAFVTCSYLKTDKKITLDIPSASKICRFNFTYPHPEKAKIPADFFCE